MIGQCVISGMLPTEKILDYWRPSSGDWDWPTEFAEIIQENDGMTVAALISDIAQNGISEPLLLGDDRRVLDGHHRLMVAQILGIRELPVMEMKAGSVYEICSRNLLFAVYLGNGCFKGIRDKLGDLRLDAEVLGFTVTQVIREVGETVSNEFATRTVTDQREVEIVLASAFWGWVCTGDAREIALKALSALTEAGYTVVSPGQEVTQRVRC